MPSIFQLISTALAVVGVALALIQYSRAQRFRRIQNLSAIWERFFKEERTRNLFNLLNDLELSPSPELVAKLSSPALNTDKLFYLAILEDVALYARLGEIDRLYAIDRFQWLFVYVFEREATRDAFWSGLGGAEERGQPYWRLSRTFAAQCAANLR